VNFDPAISEPKEWGTQVVDTNGEVWSRLRSGEWWSSAHGPRHWGQFPAFCVIQEGFE
jgi:hypothetical protein